MLEKQKISISLIYVPSKRAKTLDSSKVLNLAEDILENGQTTPISLREDGARYVLIEGYHRLEAMRALGEEVIESFLVGVRLH